MAKSSPLAAMLRVKLMELVMNTKYLGSLVNENESAKNKTLKTLFQVICADNEFTLLRHTLELYCEEIAAHRASTPEAVISHS